MYLVPHQTYENIPQILFREHPLLEQTLRLIRVAHRGQLYNGQPYFHHPIRVALRMNWYDVNSDELYASLLHDTVEDTELTFDDLCFFNYTERTLELVALLTREKDGDQTYRDYIFRLLATEDMSAIRIKLCDLYENSNNVRFLPLEKRKVMIRYGKSIKAIRDYLVQNPEGAKILENTISGELDKDTLEAWIRTKPAFL